MAAWGTVQIMGRLATACNLLKFKVIFCSPMGMPFACCTAVTNRCNLLIMWLRYAWLHLELSLIVSNVTLALHRRTRVWMAFVNDRIFTKKYTPGNRMLGYILMQKPFIIKVDVSMCTMLSLIPQYVIKYRCFGLQGWAGYQSVSVRVSHVATLRLLVFLLCKHVEFNYMQVTKLLW